VRCDPRRIGFGRALVTFVRRAEHELRVIPPQQPPIELVALALRSLDDVEPEHVAIELDRGRHVEDLQQRAHAPHLDAHLIPLNRR
jgi:hypothetical protein